ncbi:MAG: tRNA 5-methoxyuridine(34)/uridine 5-oxyacetic acid(34) synthase CmoB [Pseudomonadota bacterium]
MIDLTEAHFRETLEATVFSRHAEALTHALIAEVPKHGDWPSWAQAISALPESVDSVALAPTPTIRFSPPPDGDALAETLMALHPWRKGPWRFDSVEIDAEWRSDQKWDRLIDAGIDFRDARVLDIGGGNGYFSIRAAAEASAVLNVDPTLLFYAQFLAFTRAARLTSVAMVPLRFESLPPVGSFNIVMSMGVLYHRRDPFEHLQAIKSRLNSKGLLILETLVVDGNSDTVLVPRDRYARMRNVWFLPSVEALKTWLARAGFTDIECHDVTTTSADEQRATPWMRFESLDAALLPGDPSTTIEGHPAPCRALLTARTRST